MGRRPGFEKVTRKAESVLAGLDAERAAPLPDAGDGVVGVGVVRGGPRDRGPEEPSLPALAEGLAGGTVDRPDGVGYGFLRLHGRRLPNVGVLVPDDVASLRAWGFRVLEEDDSPAYSVVLVVPPSDGERTETDAEAV